MKKDMHGYIMKKKSKRNHKKNNRIKKLVMLATLIGVSILSYKGYINYVSEVEQIITVVTGTKIGTTNSKSKGHNVIKTKNIVSKESGYIYDVESVKNILDNKGKKDGKKIVFLTFDDGPSTTVTPKILNVLKKYNVKATFFLVGNNIDSNNQSKKVVKRIFNEGHALGNHTYSHNMKNLYPRNKVDLECFMKEVEKTDDSIKNVVGQGNVIRVLRMPGGYMSRKYYNDPNLEKLNNLLEQKGLYSLDWNAYDYDSEGDKKNRLELLEEVKKSVGSKEKVVLLMHDTYGKEETARALPQIIEYLKEKGYEFKTIS